MIFLIIITKILALGLLQLNDSILSSTPTYQSRRFTYHPNFDDFKKYIHFELLVGYPQQSCQQLLMTCSLNQIPYMQNDGTVNATYVDLNSYYYNSNNNIIIKPRDVQYNQSDNFYINIFTPNGATCYYNLTVSLYLNPPCPNNCNNQQGNCLQGMCDCRQSYLDLDCSKTGMELDIDSNLIFVALGYNYFYYQQKNISTNKLQFTFENLLNNSDFNVNIYLMLEDFKFGVPNSHNYLLKSDGENQKVQLNLDPSQIQFLPELNRYQRVILSLYSQNHQNLLIKLQNIEGGSNDDSRIRIVYICGAVALFIVLAIIIYVTCKCKDRPPQQSQVVKQQADINISIIDQYIPKYKYLQIFETLQFRRKFLTKQLNESCTVCLVEFQDNTECRFSPCLHIFHSECLELWLLKHQNCPNCRLKINQTELIKYEKDQQSHLDYDQKQLGPFKQTPMVNNIQKDHDQDQAELIQFE